MENSRHRGFSLLELLFAAAVLLVMSLATFSALAYMQRSYTSTVQKADVNSGIRGVMELMTQEVGQAGLLPFTPVQLSSAAISTSSPQTVSLSSAAGVFVGKKLLVDTGNLQELVTVTAVSGNSITARFIRAHNAGVVVIALGVFPQGVLSSSSATQLQMFGDINADGTLVYVRYDCDVTAGTLSRSVTSITAGGASPAVVLVQNLVANPGGAPCFAYTSASAQGFTFVTSVTVTLSTQSANVDPQTGARATLSNSVLNLTPRNVVAGLDLALAKAVDRLQPTPPGLPLP